MEDQDKLFYLFVLALLIGIVSYVFCVLFFVSTGADTFCGGTGKLVVVYYDPSCSACKALLAGFKDAGVAVRLFSVLDMTDEDKGEMWDTCERLQVKKCRGFVPVTFVYGAVVRDEVNDVGLSVVVGYDVRRLSEVLCE